MKAADVKVSAPTAWTTQSITASSAAVALPTTGSTGSGQTKRVWLKADVKTHVLFAAGSTTATTSHGYLTADVDYVIDVPASVTHVAGIRGGSSDGTLFVAVV